MGNLKLNYVQVVDSATIIAKFTSDLSPYINPTNISIESQFTGVPDSKAISVEIYGSTLTINVDPLTPVAPYYISFKSSSISQFKSVNGDSFLDDYDPANRKLIIGPAETENPVQQYLYSYLQDNLYNVTDTNTFINKIVQGLSLVLSKSFYDIKQVKNENYISFTVQDEEKIRGQGPFDRLNEEGAYDIIRISKTPTGDLYNIRSDIDFFTRNKITLQSKLESETLSIYDKDDIGFFNYKTFTLNLRKQNVIKLDALEFTYLDGRPSYVYDVATLGYKLSDPGYDEQFSFPYRSLKSNQIMLNDSIFSNGGVSFASPQNIKINVKYKYKDLGRYVNPQSISVTTTLKATREEIPPHVSVFNLAHAPILDESDNVAEIGAVHIFNMNSIKTSDLHPAFMRELKFKLDYLPSMPGDYAIDYLTGTVYVYGESNFNRGTGPTPPLLSYRYRHTYKDSIDYAYDPDYYEIAALPNGELIGSSAKLSFEYEDVLVNGIDYHASVHKEVIGERVNNRIFSDGSVKLLNSPITNVFRIINETSGEVYTPNRWSNDRLYYSFVNPPRFNKIDGERVSFTDVYGETLLKNKVITNSVGKRILVCNLANPNIISKSEDCIGSSINSSVIFSNKNTFKLERWFDTSSINNPELLKDVGDYQIDYTNGIVYVVVDVNPANEPDLGNVSYKKSNIKTSNKHITNIDNIYYNIDGVSKVGKKFNYISFSDDEIHLKDKELDFSDEKYININGIVSNINTSIPGTETDIKSIRSVYDGYDLLYNSSPINFALESEANGNFIKINPIIKSKHDYIKFDIIDGYYIELDFNSDVISSNITFSLSVQRESDGALFATILKPGHPTRVILSGSSPNTNDLVFVNLSVSINNLSTVIVDYNRGELYVDYVHLADEILVSYEYGENLIDFRNTNSIRNGQSYYVSYKVGALRDSLLANFGGLANLPELSTQDLELNREIYRDAISAVFESIKDGPTARNIKNVVKKMAHVEPEIKESLFSGWSLGSSLLSPQNISLNGDFKFGKGKYDRGIILSKDKDTITIPVSSNFRLESGTFQSWIVPDWDGIDNDAQIIISITEGGLYYDLKKVFVGAAEFHPKYDFMGGHSFSIRKTDVLFGRPNLNKNGIFIFYDKDPSGLFDRWYISVVNDYLNGNLKIDISTTGKFYDAKLLPVNSVAPTLPDSKFYSSNNSITFELNKNTNFYKEISFVSDKDHYILDFGEHESKNRFSLFKDTSGFLNFKVIDKYGSIHSISHDVSRWKRYQAHHVSISWSLNSKNNQDEMHLFVDGMEVPNIIKYGSKASTVGSEKFRVLSKEEIFDVVDKNIISSNDMKTFSGQPSAIILATSLSGIMSGDTIFINEPGFDPSGYTIISISNNTINLSSPLPLSLEDARFTINKKKIYLDYEFDNHTKFILSKISLSHYGNDLIIWPGSYVMESPSYNFEDENIKPGDTIIIYGPSFSVKRTIISANQNIVTLDEFVPFNTSPCEFGVYKNIEVELRGPRSIKPSYDVEELPSGNCAIVLLDGISKKDILTIKKLGLNEKRIINSYYNWSDSNTIKTTLTQPTSLSSVKITKIILPKTQIKPSNSSLTSSNFTYSATSSPNNITIGRLSSKDPRSVTVQVSTNNIDFTNPLTVKIVGLPVDETITFSGPGMLRSTNYFTSISDIIVDGTPIKISDNFMTLEVREYKPITQPDNPSDQDYASIRYSYQVRSGNDLTCSDGVHLYDSSPWQPSLVGSFINLISLNIILKIKNVGIDYLGGSFIELDSPAPIPAITNEPYEILDASSKYSGFQNGYFIFEKANLPGIPHVLPPGTYEIDMRAPLSIKLDPFHGNAFFGTDFNGKNNMGGVLSEIKVNIDKLTDTRVGENFVSNQETITKNFNSIKRIWPNKNTLVFCRLNELPALNEAPFYLLLKDKNMLEPSVGVNDTFDRSVYIKDRPIILENNGILNPGKEGTIEFWVNPQYDSVNDYSDRFYFDAASIIKEEVVSINDSTIQVKGNVGKILKVSLKNSSENIDYFAGGSVEISPSGARIETIDISNDIIENESNISFIITEDRTDFVYMSGSMASLSVYEENGTLFFNKGRLKINKFKVDPISLNLSSADMIGKKIKILNAKNKNNNNTYYIVDYDPLTYTLTILNDMDSYVTLPPSSPKILQVISVKLFEDDSGTDYFHGGAVGKDGRTIYLGKGLPYYVVPFRTNPPRKKVIVTYKPNDGNDLSLNSKIIRLNRRLPKHKSTVVVTYVPSGLSGNRMSIYKDSSGFLNFSIYASQIEYKVRVPIFWQKNTWHRVKASYKVNTPNNKDEISLFVDGYEYTNVTIGPGVLFDDTKMFGLSYHGKNPDFGSIKVTDLFNNLYFGSDFNEKNTSYCLIDNLRISNISRPRFMALGQSIDVNYNKNISMALPVKKDAYTTLLWDFDHIVVKGDDFASLVNKKFGGTDFSVNIFDSFGIIGSSQKVKDITEKLIKVLKPANSRVFLKYFD